MKLPVVMPACNEVGTVEETLSALVCPLRAAVIPFEIVLVDDGSMADGSDSPEDVVTGYRRLL